MRLTELWTRLEQHLGSAYAHSWARDHVISGLGSQTVEEAIADGIDTVDIWRAVHLELALPARDR